MVAQIYALGRQLRPEGDESPGAQRRGQWIGLTAAFLAAGRLRAVVFFAAAFCAAAALPHIDVAKPDRVIGTNTVDCMRSGVFWGYVGLINGICDRIKEEYGHPMKVVSTGGLAPLFQQGHAVFDVFEDDLTMHGLTVIHDYNKEG